MEIVMPKFPLMKPIRFPGLRTSQFPPFGTTRYPQFGNHHDGRCGSARRCIAAPSSCHDLPKSIVIPVAGTENIASNVEFFQRPTKTLYGSREPSSCSGPREAFQDERVIDKITSPRHAGSDRARPSPDDRSNMSAAQGGCQPAWHESVHELHALDVARRRHDLQ